MNRKKINNILEELYKTQWQVVFNQQDNIYTERVIDMASDYEIFRQKLFEQLIVDSYDLNHKINNEMGKIDGDTLVKYIDQNNSYTEKWRELREETTKELYRRCSIVRGFYDEIEDIVLPFCKYLEDTNSLFKRLNHWKTKVFGTFLALDMNKIAEENGILSKNAKLLMKEKARIIGDLTALKEQSEGQITPQPKANEIKRIFNYKEMNKLAETSGYELSRFNGDHKVYIHKESNKIIVIPQHDLKYGIMCSIQKQIINNAKKENRYV